MIESRGSGSNPWIRVAAMEVHLILYHWGLSSMREASDLLGVSRNTLSKLDPRHPDGSLRLESLDRIYATFFRLVPYQFPEQEWEIERDELRRSRCRILEQSYLLPRKVRERVEREIR